MNAKKILLILGGVFVIAAFAVAVAVAVLLPRYVESEVIRAARERGVELVPGEVSFGIGWVQVTNARLTLIGVPGLRVEAGLIDAELDGRAPKRFGMSRVTATLVSDPVTFAQELQGWARTHAPRLREPLSVKPLAFTFRTEPDAPVQLALEAAELQADGERALLVAGRARLRDLELGELRVSQGEQRTRVDVTLGQSSLDNPLVSIDAAFPDASPGTLHLALSPITLGKLGQILRVQLPKPDVTVSGTAEARVPAGLDGGARITGQLDFALKGYIPPHPVELDGFVFGDTTTISAGYTLEPEKLGILLDPVKLKAGAFALSGKGEVRAEGGSARLLLALLGALPCNALAGAALESRLGRSLGKVSGKAARQVVAGSVGVRVSVDAALNDVERARVLRTISPGCGLKPLTLEELVKLGEIVPEALDPKVAKDFEDLINKNFPGLLPPPGSITLKIPPVGSLPFPELLPPSGKKPSRVAPAPSTEPAAPTR